jgi:hypothetical protein
MGVRRSVEDGRFLPSRLGGLRGRCFFASLGVAGLHGFDPNGGVKGPFLYATEHLPLLPCGRARSGALPIVRKLQSVAGS